MAAIPSPTPPTTTSLTPAIAASVYDKAPASFDILHLPLELQLEVYKHLLPRNRGISVDIGRSNLGEATPCYLPSLETVEASAQTPSGAITVFDGKVVSGWWWVERRHEAVIVTWSCDAHYTRRENASERVKVQTLFRLIRASPAIRAVVLPIIQQEVDIVVTAEDISLACWFGANHSLFSPALKNLVIKDAISENTVRRDRWIKQLLRVFPHLEGLHLEGLGHTTKDASVWGTRYKRDDLRTMKIVIDNSSMSHVEGHNLEDCEHDLLDDPCRDTVSFTNTSVRAPPDHTGHWGWEIGLGPDSLVIDVELELRNSLGKKQKRGTIERQ